MTDRWLGERIAAYRARYAGSRIQPLAEAVPVPGQGLMKVRAAMPHILAAQRTLLRHFLTELGPADILEFFMVPAELSRWVTALDNPDLSPPILRADVLPLHYDEARICEINIESCVGGAEIADLFRLEQLRAGAIPHPAPYEQLTTLIGQTLAAIEGDKVCIFDWSHWQNSGWFTLERLHAIIAAGLPGIEVFLADENCGIDRVDARTIVFRAGPSQDFVRDPNLTSELFGRAGFVLSDFSTDLLSSKIWLAVYHDSNYRNLLTDTMVDAIDTTIPYTEIVEESNLNRLLDAKDRFFFKAADDFGGRSVVPGHTTTSTEIRTRILGSGPARWIAQERCDVAPLEVRPFGSPTSLLSTSVLGIYRFGSQWSGVMVRASTESEVVNVAGGSFIGWGFEV